MERVHIQWIDSLKGFGIICVTLGHLGCFFPLEKHIYSFHMFLFFFISGLLYTDDRSLLEYISHRFKQLFVPFVFWDIASTIVDVRLGEDIVVALEKMLIINGQLCWNAPIWFLLVLFITECSYKAISYVTRHEKSMLVSHVPIILISLVLWTIIGSLSLPFKINLVPISLAFFCFGYICQGLLLHYTDTHRSPFLLITILLLVLINLVFGVFINCRVSFTAGIWGNHLFCILAALSGVLLYCLLFSSTKLLGESRLLAYLGNNSLIILVTQYWFFRFYDILSFKLFALSVWHSQSTLKAILLALITMGMICGFAELFKRASKNNSVLNKMGSHVGIR